MVETAFVSAIGVMLGAISVYVPGFAFLAFLVTPAAIGIIGTKWGRPPHPAPSVLRCRFCRSRSLPDRR